MKKDEKKLKILKYAIVFLVALLIFEFIYFGIKMYNSRKNSTYYSVTNDVITIDNGYVGVGLSDSKHSKFIKYENPGYNKPYLWIYDSNMKTVNELKLDKGYNGSYNDIVEVDDGYIVVGSLEMSESDHKSALTEAIIVKYDKKFNLIWRKNLNILDTSQFNAVKVDKDGNYIVVGSSLYASDVIGNQTTGGAIIVKYDKDGNELLRINHGGPKTGAFNDVEILSDGYVVVGVKESGTGIIFKFNFNGKEIWHNYYGYTDSKGLTSISIDEDGNYIVTGSKLTAKGETENYKAAIVKFSNKGTLLEEEQYQKDKITRFNDSLVLDDKIIAIGVYGYQKDKLLVNQSISVIFDNDLTKIEEQNYEGNNTYTLNKIINLDKDYLLVGYTNSKIKNLKSNGLDYYPVILKINK